MQMGGFSADDRHMDASVDADFGFSVGRILIIGERILSFCMKNFNSSAKRLSFVKCGNLSEVLQKLAQFYVKYEIVLASALLGCGCGYPLRH